MLKITSLVTPSTDPQIHDMAVASIKILPLEVDGKFHKFLIVCHRWQNLADNNAFITACTHLGWLCEPTFLKENFDQLFHTARGHNTTEQNLMQI